MAQPLEHGRGPIALRKWVPVRGRRCLSEVEGANCVGIVISRQRGKNIQKPWVMTGNDFTLFLGEREEGRRRHGRRQMPNMSGL